MMADPKSGTPRGESRGSRRSPWLYVGSIVILVIVVVAFVGAPVVSGFASPGRLVFGRYDGRDIAYQPGNYFARQYDAIAQQIQQQGNRDNLELQLRLAWREAFNRTVLHHALLSRADESGVTVSEARIDELIARDPRFFVDGRFSARAYRDLGSQQQFQLRTYYRETARVRTVIEDVLANPVVAEAEAQFVARMAGPERRFDVVRFPFSEFPDDQVRSYAEENASLFTSLDLAVITLASEDEAEEIRSQALEPATPIADLARTYSRDLYADQGGEIGRLPAFELQQELVNRDEIDAILALDAGDTSAVIETTSGWSFYRALSAPQPLDLEADGSLVTVREYMNVFEQGRIQDFTRASAEAFVARVRAGSFEEVVAAEEREPIAVDYFPVNYGNVQLFNQARSGEIPDLADAAFRAEFFEAGFGTPLGAVADPIVLRQSVIVLRPVEERPARESDVEFIADFYGSILEQFQSDLVEDAYVDQDELRDDFTAVFEQAILGGG